MLGYATVRCAGVSCEIVPHQRLDEVLWEKAAVNCYINPLAALLNCTNGQLVDPRMDLARCVSVCIQLAALLTMRKEAQ